MNFRQLTTFIVGPAGFVILIFFFLPWITVSCSGTEILDASGMKLASGVEENDFEVDASNFGLDESMFEGSGLEGSGDIEFDSTLEVDDPGVEASFLDADAKLYLLPIIGMLALVIGAGSYFEPRLLNSVTVIGGLILPSLIGVIIMLIKYIQISGDMSDIEEQSIAEGGINLIQLSYQPGWWLTILGLLAVFGAGALAFLTEGQPMAAAALPVDELEKRLMEEARAQIQAKNYEEARKILKTVKNPLAEQWLQKLDEIDPFGS